MRAVYFSRNLFCPWKLVTGLGGAAPQEEPALQPLTRSSTPTAPPHRGGKCGSPGRLSSSSPGGGVGYRGLAGKSYLCGTPRGPQAWEARPNPGLGTPGASRWPGSEYPLVSSCSDFLPGPGCSNPPPEGKSSPGTPSRPSFLSLSTSRRSERAGTWTLESDRPGLQSQPLCSLVSTPGSCPLTSALVPSLTHEGRNEQSSAHELFTSKPGLQQALLSKWQLLYLVCIYCSLWFFQVRLFRQPPLGP